MARVGRPTKEEAESVKVVNLGVVAVNRSTGRFLKYFNGRGPVWTNRVRLAEGFGQRLTEDVLKNLVEAQVKRGPNQKRRNVRMVEGLAYVPVRIVIPMLGAHVSA